MSDDNDFCKDPKCFWREPYEIHWCLNEEFHRENGPAVITSNGTKKWILNNSYHRVNGPAIEWSDGSKWWYQNNKLHREDGPAVECNGRLEWWLDDEQYTEEEYRLEMKIRNNPKLRVMK